LIHFVYPDLFIHSDPKYFVEREILTLTNEYVNAINANIMIQFPGEVVEYLSADTVEEADNQWPLEFLNSLTIGGLPPHKLLLKLGIPIVLLCNIQPSSDLCNGTRLVYHFF